MYFVENAIPVLTYIPSGFRRSHIQFVKSFIFPLNLVVLLLAAIFLGGGLAGVHAACITEPIMQGQDPQAEYKDGYFYLVQSDGCNVWLRESATLGGLATPTVNQIILSPGCSNVWAPEIHWFSNKWYLYYSLGSPDHPNHRVYVAESQGTTATGPYTIKGVLFNDYWNIDGSVFVAANGQYYFIFSGSPSGSQQNIYIAPMSNPYTLSGSPVMISAPTQSWEINGAPPAVNEGPFGFAHNGRTFIDYSASGCWTDDYCLGLLTLTGSNPLNAAAWTKTGPVFSKQPGAYGPGHNCVVVDGSGQWWNLYHANDLSGQGCGGYRQTSCPAGFLGCQQHALLWRARAGRFVRGRGHQLAGGAVSVDGHERHHRRDDHLRSVRCADGFARLAKSWSPFQRHQ